MTPRPRRQFHPGTEEEWHRTVNSPPVKRALRDPKIAQALYQNFRGMGGKVPMAGMADGGGVPSAEQVNQMEQMQQAIGDEEGQPPLRRAVGGMANAMDTNELVQMLNDPNTPETRKQTLRLALARMNRPAPPPLPQTSMPQTAQAPLRFQGGGVMGGAETAQTIAAYQQIANDPTVPETTRARYRTQIAALQAQQMTPGAATGAPGAVGNISAGTMQGLTKLGASGVPANLQNTAMPMGIGALMGAGATGKHPLAGALIGAATAGLMNFLARNKPGQAKPKGVMGTDAEGVVGGNAERNAVAPSAYQGGTSSTAAGATPNAPGTPQGTANVEAKFEGSSTNPPPANTVGPNVGGQNLYMGSANSPSGNVMSPTGAPGSWIDQSTGQPWSGQVLNATNILGNVGMGASPAAVGPLAPDVLPTTPAFMSDPSLGMGSGMSAASNAMSGAASDAAPLTGEEEDLLAEAGPEFKRGGRVSKKKFADGGNVPVMPAKSPREVLRRKPAGAAIPVLHTTIVIMAKPKKGSKNPKPTPKRFGGVSVPRKPKAIPPERGPGDYAGPVKAHGRVQVPRGSGAAIRGKRFGGIY